LKAFLWLVIILFEGYQNPMQNEWDLIVVGGGAAGVFAAISAAEVLGNDAQILVLEKSPHFLGKVKISGGGRCNVTNACFDPAELSQNFPRGEKALLGPLYRWGVQDTIEWFQSHGVNLKTESDGRMFPVSDESQTIIDCLLNEVRTRGVQLRKSHGVESIFKHGEAGFEIVTDQGDVLQSRTVLLATGGTRNVIGEKLAQELGHSTEPAVPSLFTFKISNVRIDGLQGVSVPEAKISVEENPKLTSTGPLLITHWGLSGPAALRLSAWGARELEEMDYRFTLKVNWVAGSGNIENQMARARQENGKRRVAGSSPIEAIPKRLWKQFCQVVGVAEDCIWSQMPKATERRLIDEFLNGRFKVMAKSMNKEEFVTCGGVCLKEIDLRTMESKLCTGLYFAGEILDIDGITGGFNFQNAWTSGHLAGEAIADALRQ